MKKKILSDKFSRKYFIRKIIIKSPVATLHVHHLFRRYIYCKYSNELLNIQHLSCGTLHSINFFALFAHFSHAPRIFYEKLQILVADLQ